MLRRVLLLLTLLPLPAAAQDWSLCQRAIARVEPGSGLPPGLLRAIGLVESGRADPASGRLEPWPWAINAGGEGRWLASKPAAIAAVEALRAAGSRSVDVGCMQVNLFHHPTAFPDLEAAFDPERNVRYAARFLLSLRAASDDWGSAIARYHSGDEQRGAGYQRRVALARLGLAWQGGGGAVPLRAAAGLRGLCAPGLTPALVLRPGAGGGRQPRLACRR